MARCGHVLSSLFLSLCLGLCCCLGRTARDDNIPSCHKNRVSSCDPSFVKYSTRVVLGQSVFTAVHVLVTHLLHSVLFVLRVAMSRRVVRCGGVLSARFLSCLALYLAFVRSLCLSVYFVEKCTGKRHERECLVTCTYNRPGYVPSPFPCSFSFDNQRE